MFGLVVKDQPTGNLRTNKGPGTRKVEGNVQAEGFKKLKSSDSKKCVCIRI